MTTRKIMPPRRYSIRQKAKIGRLNIYLDVGLYPDGKVGELFITVEKTGGRERWLFDSLARMASLALQSGASLEHVAGQWVGTKGQPAGPVQGDARIKYCTSPLDYAGRHLLVNFCGRDYLAHVPTVLEVEEGRGAL